MDEMEGEYDIVILDDRRFKFYHEEDCQTFLHAAVTAKIRRIARNHTSVALKNLDEYFQNCYFAEIRKELITFKEGSLEIDVHDPKIVAFLDDKLQKPDAELRSFARRRRVDLSDCIDQIHQALRVKVREAEDNLRELEKIQIPTGLSAPNAQHALFKVGNPKVYLHLDNRYDSLLDRPHIRGKYIPQTGEFSVKGIKGFVFKDGEYRGPDFMGEHRSFDAAILEQVDNIFRNEWDWKFFLGPCLPIFKVTKAYRHLHSIPWCPNAYKEAEVYYIMENFAHFSDGECYAEGYKGDTPPAPSYFFVLPNEKGGGDIVLAPTKPGHAYYYFWCTEGKLELALAFLSRYFTSAEANKRQGFPSADSGRLEQFGISNWYKG